MVNVGNRHQWCIINILESIVHNHLLSGSTSDPIVMLKEAQTSSSID